MWQSRLRRTVIALHIGQSGYLSADALFVAPNRRPYLAAAAAVHWWWRAAAPLRVTRTPDGYVVDVTASHGRWAERPFAPDGAVSVLRVIHGDELLFGVRFGR